MYSAPARCSTMLWLCLTMASPRSHRRGLEPPFAPTSRGVGRQASKTYARLGTLRFRGSTSDIAVAFFPDGRHLVTAGHQASVWDVGTGKLVRRVPAPNAGLASVAVSPDGKLLATCGTDQYSRAETVIRLWDAATAK